jgi:thiol-disulfide isomerase/thioredoxin
MTEEEDESPRRSFASRYSTFVGIAFLALVVYVTLNTIRTNDGGVLGVGDADKGQPLSEFAVPDIRGDVDGDANIFQDDCSTGSNPCPDGDRRSSACNVDLEGILRVCDYFDKPLAISFWFTKGGDCLPTEDTFNSLSQRFPQVNFLSINVRDDRDKVEQIVAERGWTVPVGWDRDGAVSNLYRVGVCPSVALAYPGGILRGGLIGSEDLDQKRLSKSLQELVAESKQRQEDYR